MGDWRAFVLREFFTIGGIAAAATAGLLVILWFLLARAERRKLRMPAALLVLHVLVVSGHRALEGRIPLERPLAIFALLLLLVALGRVGFLLVVDWLIGRRLGRPMPRIVRDIVQGLVYVVAALAVFRALGVELGSLLTTSAILTAVIGLSLQETLGNLLAGLAVQAERPFEVGDWVQFGDANPVVGCVVEINWRATKVRTKDLVETVVPNAVIAKSSIHNLRRPSPILRRNVRLQGPSDVAPNRMRGLLLDALRGCPGVLSDPPPRVWTASFADRGIEYLVAFSIDDFGSSVSVESDVRDRIWYALSRVGIALPGPVCDVRMRRMPASRPGADVELDAVARAGVLADAELFGLLPKEALAHMAEHAQCLLFARGESIVFEGDPGKALFVIVRGEVAVITDPSSTDAREIARLGSNEVFGELSLLTGVRDATVRAVSDTMVLRIGYGEFRSAIEDFPGLGESLVKRLAERMQQQVHDGQDAPPADAGAHEIRAALFDRIRRFFAD